MNPHILVVDDDPGVTALLSDYLSDYDLRVTMANDGRAMRGVLEREVVDLVILDVRMPGEDGLTLMRNLRGSSRIPVILLTTCADEVDRILGLELGADDYVTKPFSARELLARTRAVLRRIQQHADAHPPDEEVQALRFEGWELDLRTKRLCAPNGARVDLTQAEARLLQAFLRSPRRTLSRDQLLDLSRGHSEDVFDRSIDVQILRLRRKLEADPSRPKLIRTERGSGYFLDAKVEVVE